MDDIYGAIIQRNARETLPFVSLVNSNKYLETHVDALSARCESLERQYLVRGGKLMTEFGSITCD